MKKALLEKIIPPSGSSFFMIHNKEPHVCNTDFWHFHPEFEIVYIPHGNGKRFVGNQISSFKNGDLLLLGPNIPHNTFYFGFESDDYEEYVIQFHGTQIENLSKDYSEFIGVNGFLKKAQTGIFFDNTVKHRIGQLITEMIHLHAVEKLLRLFWVLQLMAESTHYKSLQATQYLSVSVTNTQRVQTVYAIIQKNYHTDLSTRELAKEIAMTESSFCRFFVKSTGKTFKQALTEVRIQYACNFLINSDAPVQSIAFDCGFNSVSLFNRLFKKITNMSPNKYRQTFLNDIQIAG